jgi:hypothetical protein
LGKIKWPKYILHWLCPSSTVVEYLTLNPKIKASNLAIGISKEKMVKNMFHQLCPSSTMVQYPTLNPKIKASNHANGIGRGKMAKQNSPVMPKQHSGRILVS